MVMEMDVVELSSSCTPDDDDDDDDEDASIRTG